MRTPKDYGAILVAGSIAGAMDITAAFVNGGLQGRSPVWVLQSIASGLLGAESYKRGLGSAALGAVVHFLIAFVAAAAYYLASRALKLVVERAIVCGAIYGVAVYLFMYLIVLPVTFHRSFVHPASAVAIGLGIHVTCVGLPIALTIRRYSK